jgi:uncharacterized protein YecE (DUF72 family)
MNRVGCCGWPVKREEYFRHFSLVEIQESFYNLPQLKTVERWRAGAPPDFEFVLKAPQLITHEPTSPTYRRLRKKLTEAEKKRYGAFKLTAEVHAAWEATLTLAKALRSRSSSSNARSHLPQPGSTEGTWRHSSNRSTAAAF